MDCQYCEKQGAKCKRSPKIYGGTKSWTIERRKGQTDETYYLYFCNADCYRKWWESLTWHYDCIDERMNANIHFVRISGNKGTYKGIPVDASWNGLDARHFGIKDYEFRHRRPCPDGHKKCV